MPKSNAPPLGPIFEVKCCQFPYQSPPLPVQGGVGPNIDRCIRWSQSFWWIEIVSTMFNSAAINCVPHSPHYGKGWGVGGGWEISKYPTPRDVHQNWDFLQFTSHNAEFKVHYSGAQTSSKRVPFPHQFPHPTIMVVVIDSCINN